MLGVRIRCQEFHLVVDGFTGIAERWSCLASLR
jgi:hypothetical protein